MKNQVVLLFLILLIGCFGQFASDIYTPSLLAIASSFKVPVALSQWSMVSFLLGVVLGMIFYGPVSEGVGRRLPLLIGLFITLVGSLVCAFSSSIEMLIVGRFIQGCGAAAGMTLWRSIFRDTYSGADIAKYGSYLGIFIVFIIPFAPMIGGYLQHYFNWRASFIFLSVYAAISLLCVLTLYKETASQAHRDRLKIKFVLTAYRELLTSRIFLGGALCAFLCYGAFFSWFVVGPILLIHLVAVSPIQFGWISLCLAGITSAAASLINAKLVSRLGVSFMLRCAFSLIAFAGVLLFVLSDLFAPTLWAIVIPVFIFYFAVSFVWPNIFASVFQPFGHISGYAASLYCLLQVGGGAALSLLMTYLPTTTTLPLAVIFTCVGGLSLIIYTIAVGVGKLRVYAT